MLGHRGRCQGDQVGELAKAKFLAPQCQQQSDPGFVREGFGNRQEISHLQSRQKVRRLELRNVVSTGSVTQRQVTGTLDLPTLCCTTAPCRLHFVLWRTIE